MERQDCPKHTNGDGPCLCDKFTLPEEERYGRNRELLSFALAALYETYVVADTIARKRGEAIQAINSMARAMGYPDIVRND